nr:TPA_asm: hypothetical protein HUJ06_028829 [Nelumbo nucifera]
MSKLALAIPEAHFHFSLSTHCFANFSFSEPPNDIIIRKVAFIMPVCSDYDGVTNKASAMNNTKLRSGLRSWINAGVPREKLVVALPPDVQTFSAIPNKVDNTEEDGYLEALGGWMLFSNIYTPSNAENFPTQGVLPILIIVLVLL